VSRVRRSVWPTAVGLLMAVAAASPRTSAAQRKTAAAATTAVPISNVRYDVTIDSTGLRSRRIAVTMQFQVRTSDPLVLSLPAWSPGHYVLLWFARRISDFRVESEGAPLPWRMLDYQTWRIVAARNSVVRISFRYLADTVDRAVAWTRPDFAFFNGTNLFLYPKGASFNWPATVTLHLAPGWKVATGMTPAGGASAFEAKNYHDLVDMPFFVGHFDLDSIRVNDSTWVRLATYPEGALADTHRQSVLAWLGKIAPVEGAVFGEIPWRTYTVLQLSDTVVNGGGLEHQNSQLDEIVIGQVNAPGLHGLYAHEMFHSWNVKRLRPADLVPYRYDDAQPTPWLWVSEGVTDYYAALALVRSGIIDAAGFNDRLAGAIARVRQTPPVALGDASLSAWIGPTDGTGGIYYPKGAVAGLMLDIMIRDASDNAHSLDDVMRSLYRETYRQSWRGFTAHDWWATVSREAGGRSFSDFDRRYITGREPFPLDSVLALGGLAIQTDTLREIRLGVAPDSDSVGVRIADIVPNGAAAAAGARVGDYLVSIGDVAVRGAGTFDSLRAKYQSTTASTLPLVVRRDGQLLTLPMPVQLVPRVRVRVADVPDASAKAVRIREGLRRKPTA